MSTHLPVGEGSGPSGSELRFRCSTAARWLPRALGAAVLVAALLASYRLENAVSPAIVWSRYFVVMVGAIGALWIVRQGGELKRTLRLADDAIVFGDGRGQSRLPFGEIESLAFASSFSVTRSWLPATLLLDRHGQSWRVSALIERGDRLIDELVRRTGRHDLEVWAETLRLRQRMSRASIAVATRYLAAVAVLGAAVVFYLR